MVSHTIVFNETVHLIKIRIAVGYLPYIHSVCSLHLTNQVNITDCEALVGCIKRYDGHDSAHRLRV